MRAAGLNLSHVCDETWTGGEALSYIRLRSETTTTWFAGSACERRLTSSKFDKSDLRSNRYGFWAEPFEVVRLLPHENGIFQYRIKSVGDGHERVILENEVA
jgi:hypothetical protein